jgi:hypothetical protein
VSKENFKVISKIENRGVWGGGELMCVRNLVSKILQFKQFVQTEPKFIVQLKGMDPE